MRGDWMAVSAPGTKRPVTEVQVVRTSGGSDVWVPEIQLVGISLEFSPEVQTFHTTAAPHATIAGSFKIGYPGKGFTLAIPATADADAVEAAIEDMLDVGDVVVSRTPYLYCACNEAYTWTITFLELKAPVKQLKIDVQLTGDGAEMSPVATLQQATRIQGSFRLTLGEHVTRPLPHDISAPKLQKALAEDLGLEVEFISVLPPTVTGGQNWQVTFRRHVIDDVADIPMLGSDSSQLLPLAATVWHQTLQDGRSPLTGHYQLAWRNETTAPLRYDATATQVEAALEVLAMVEDVTVRRFGPSPSRGYDWVVTFHHVLRWSALGYVTDEPRSYEPLQATSLLLGTDPSITVLVSESKKLDQTGYERAGSTGEDAGAVWMYAFHEHSWQEYQQLLGNDTEANDYFGFSLSLGSDLLFVGAPYADHKAVVQQQQFACAALSGSFAVLYDSVIAAEAVPFNATEDQVNRVFREAWKSKWLQLPYIEVVLERRDRGVCEDNAATLTLYSPTFNPEGMPLLPLQVVTTDLVDAEISFAHLDSKVVESSFSYSGGVYIFELAANGSSDSSHSHSSMHGMWQLKQKLRALAPSGGDLFGWAVAYSGGLIAVGSPGSDVEQGAVDVFAWDHNASIAHHVAKLDAEPWGRENGDKFGSTVAIGYDAVQNLHDVVVGSPGKRGGAGAAYVFTFKAADLLQIQELTSSDALVEPAKHRFGCSLAIDQGRLVVGACEAPGIVPDGRGSFTQEPNVGAVFVFQRPLPFKPYEFHQKLVPSRLTGGARFGRQVSLNEGVLAAASLQDYSLTWRSCAPVVELTVETNTSELLGPTAFTLSWQQANDSGTWEWRSTETLFADYSPDEIQAAIEQQLGTGRLEVTAGPYIPDNRTYTWHITFLEREENIGLLNATPVPVYNRCNGAVTTEWVNPPCERVASRVHVFSRLSSSSSSGDQFVEDLYAYPYWNQPAGMFGHALAVSEHRMVVGMPNADRYIDGQNTGAVMAYSLDLLKTQVSTASLAVDEGDMAVLALEWCPAVTVEQKQQPVDFMASTLDSNPSSFLQQLIRRVFAIDVRQARQRRFDTVADLAGVAGTAIGRTWPGNKTSVWSQGAFDYRAVSDYLLLDEQCLLLETNASTTFEIHTTADTIFEHPDETIHVGVHQIGLWPSPLGRFHSTITIRDDNDGSRAFQDSASPLLVDIDTPSPPSMDVVTFVNKLDTSFAASSDLIGRTLAVEKQTGTVLIGVPSHGVNGAEHVGEVLVFRSEKGQLVELARILSPNPTQGARFGATIAISRAPDRSDVTVAVTEAAASAVHVYSSVDLVGWRREATLQNSNFHLPQHRFGESLALHHDFLAVGVPGGEAVVMYSRQTMADRTVSWSDGTLLRSPQYDYDLIVDDIHEHAQWFGSSVALSQNLLVVGAPFADYVKGGTDFVDTYATEGYTKGLGRGAVFSFRSDCPIWRLTLRAGGDLFAGSFELELDHNGDAQNVTLRMPLSAQQLKQQLEALDIVDQVHITATDHRTPTEKSYTWELTFAEDVQDPVLSVHWSGFGCEACEPFNLLLRSDPSQQVSVTRLQSRGPWQEHQKVQAYDRQRGDRFGASIALDGTQLVVGAPFSSADSIDNWGFETGTCDGWTKTGDAFEHQPTFGDNSLFRRGEAAQAPFPVDGRSSRLRGRYFIGTYEKRPGNAEVDYLQPHPDFPAGTVQGNGPQGTLTSSAFVIRGTSVSFLLGGGCDRFRVYVELLVDGMRAKRSTGNCDDTMQPHHWNVSTLQGRSAQIRIVDASSEDWGHISVDEFTFDWDIYGGHLDVTESYSGGQLARGRVDTPLSGAAYVFRFTEPGSSKNPCTPAAAGCHWVNEGKLLPSDKRIFSQFGASVAVDAKRGLIAVGAPGAFLTGLFKEIQADHPFDNLTMTQLPVSGVDTSLLFNQEAFVIDRETSIGLWSVRQRLQDIPPPTVLSAERSGAVYIFAKIPELKDPFGKTVRPGAWATVEQVKLHAPDQFARDYFGASAALSDRHLFVGSPGHDLFRPAAGTLYTFDAALFAVSYSQGEYVLLEGSWPHVVIRLTRDLAVSRERLVVSYATSEISAFGVDTETFDFCVSLYLDDRDLSCGDYEQTAGDLVFAEGAAEAAFFVRVMDNPCRQLRPRFVQLTLGLPGGSAFIGDSRMALLRIDDDDLDKEEC